MAMNLAHRLCCRSTLWAKSVERDLLPWALTDVDLGAKTLEIGPGYGANMRVLVDKTPSLTAVEIDEPLAKQLEHKYGTQAEIIHGDGTDTGLPAAAFTSVVCFTMLHHVPTPPLQDQLFAEAFRVLSPGGVFAGSDGVHSIPFQVMHFRDTYNPAPAATLPDRLRAAGFTGIDTAIHPGRQLWGNQRWRAVKP